ncbi:tetratricopeptide repeat protein (plasmid) [Tundrisphaera lichenicola]|uniref:tetratricopeptide repeat protein n=1 Tax=Tundrisphaera lichenicola TaxID=2029860 RepID=UPI003EB6AC2E
MKDQKPTEGATPGEGPGSGPRPPRERTDRIFHLNVKAVGGLVAAVVLSGIIYAIAVRNNDEKVREQVLETAATFEKEGKIDLAIRNLARYLDAHPEDMKVLEQQARITAQAARNIDEFEAAARINDKLLRRDPDAPERQETRRRLIELYIKSAAQLQAYAENAQSRTKAKEAVFNQKYQAAKTIAENLIYKFEPGENGEKIKTDQENKDSKPGDHRLLAGALEGMAAPGNPEALDEAIREYQKALRGDPGDSIAAEQLARIYLDRRDDPAQGEAILDGLVEARPGSHEVRLTRFRFFRKTRRPERAAAELEEAIRLAPSDLVVRLTAADEELARGNGSEARKHLDAIPKTLQNDLRIQVMRGMIDFNDERPEDAILGWRQGLMTVDGTDADLTWWLAHAFLRMGNVASARPLILQYRRLTSENDPLHRLLQAELEERTGRPTRAISILEAVEDELSNLYLGMASLSLGRCYEAISDRGKALQAYRRANQVDSNLSEARIAAARLLGNNADAIREIERGLQVDATDPTLQIALITALLRREAGRPQQSWREFDQAMARATKSMGMNAPLLLNQAYRLALSNNIGEAIALLEKGVASIPKNSLMWITLAEALNRAGRPGEASKVLERASKPEAVGNRASIWIARAQLLLDQGRGREARDLLESVTGKVPVGDRPEVWEALGRLDASRGDLAGARSAFTEWGRLLPEDPRPRLALLDLAEAVGDEATLRATVEALRSIDGPEDIAWRLSRAQQLLWERTSNALDAPTSDPGLDEANRLVEEVLKDAPEMPAAHLLRGRVMEQLNNPVQARIAYEKALQGGAQAALPRLVELLTRLGQFDDLERLKDSVPPSQVERLSAAASYRAGNTEAANRFLNQAFQDGGGIRTSPAWQSRMLENLGRRDRSEAVLRGAAERQPTAIQPWAELIRGLARHGKEAEVAATIEQVMALVKPEEKELAEAQLRWAAGDRKAADLAFQNAIARKPDDIALLMTAARYFKEGGEVKSAATQLEAVLKLEPKNREAVQELAVLLASQPETWNEAERLIGVEASPGDLPADRLARGMVMSRATEPAVKARAVEILQNLVEDSSAKSSLAIVGRTFLTRLLLESGQPDRAREVAAILATASETPEAIGLYIECLLGTRNIPEALRQVARLESIDPSDANAPEYRVRCIRESAGPGDAAKALVKAVRDQASRPESERFARAAFDSISAMDPTALDEAENIGQVVTGFRPSASWMLGRILARRGQLGEALDVCRASVEAKLPEDQRGAAEVAMEVATARDVDTAVMTRAASIVDEILANHPFDFAVLKMAAMIRHAQGRFEDEVQLYRKALTIQPGDPLCSNNLAWALSEGLGRPEEALPLLDEIIARQGRVFWVLDTRGVVLTRLGRLDRAIEDLKDSAAEQPSSVVLYHLARAYRKANRDQEFRQYRDEARRAGISPKELDLTERAEMTSLMSL